MNLLYQFAGVIVLYGAGWVAGYIYASDYNADLVVLMYIFFMSYIAKMLFDEGYNGTG
jgi:hypothetical protein